MRACPYAISAASTATRRADAPRLLSLCRRFPSLAALDLGSVAGGVAALAIAAPRLRCLRLRGADLSDAGLCSVAALTTLTDLDLCAGGTVGVRVTPTLAVRSRARAIAVAREPHATAGTSWCACKRNRTDRAPGGRGVPPGRDAGATPGGRKGAGGVAAAASAEPVSGDAGTRRTGRAGATGTVAAPAATAWLHDA